MSYTKTTWVNNTTPAISAENLNNIENGIETLDTLTNTLNNNINTLTNAVNGLKGTILWENQSPTSTFSSQSITLSSNDYDMLLWIFKHQNNSTELITGNSIKQYGIRNITIPGDGIVRRRTANYISDTVYSISDGLEPDGTTDNTCLIPLYVIGMKTDLF